MKLSEFFTTPLLTVLVNVLRVDCSDVHENNAKLLVLGKVCGRGGLG